MRREYTEEQVSALAERAYGSNPSFHIRLNRCVLLVIDMQDEFVKPRWTPYWVPEATKMVPLVKRFMGLCRKGKVPVMFTAFAGTNMYMDRPMSGASMPNRFPWVTDDPAWFSEGRIWRELAPHPGEVVIHKPSYGAFYDTPLETIVRRMGKDTVLLCGTLTNYCVGTTARQAYERGFKVVVGSDVTASDDSELHKAELRTLRKGFAKVLSADEIAREMGLDG